jgi:NAD(P)-dependent dehydrogenase (short-subunit alcohol dehydrogenase family)
MRTKYNQPCKSIIITGGNTGLGYQCAHNIALSDQGWQIIIASRDMNKANEAVSKLKAETGNVSIMALPLDLASLTSIRKLVHVFSKSEMPPLHAIVCNAGLQVVERTAYTKMALR